MSLREKPERTSEKNNSKKLQIDAITCMCVFALEQKVNNAAQMGETNNALRGRILFATPSITTMPTSSRPCGRPWRKSFFLLFLLFLTHFAVQFVGADGIS